MQWVQWVRWLGAAGEGWTDKGVAGGCGMHKMAVSGWVVGGAGAVVGGWMVDGGCGG